MLVTIVGIFGTNFCIRIGIASMMPVSIFNAPSIMSGIASIIVSIMSQITSDCNTFGSSSDISLIISKVTSNNPGRISAAISGNSFNKGFIVFKRSLIASGNISINAPPIDFKIFNTVGNASLTDFNIDLTPFFIDSAPLSFPDIMSVNPSVIETIPGKNPLTREFFKPSTVPSSLVMLSSNSAPALTASSLMTIPRSCASCRKSEMPVAPLFNNGKRSDADFPKISCAAAFLAVASSMPANASRVSVKTSSVLFIVPSVFFSDTPKFSNLTPAPSTPF